MNLNWNQHLSDSLVAGPVREGMAYALLGEGKRLRAQLAILSAQAVGVQISQEKLFEMAMPAALAIEYVHAYSLVHDDLPSMDNDDFRRGKPSCHKVFGEAVAILIGDALLSDAFRLLAQAPRDAHWQCFELSQAIGSTGMVAGQLDDIRAEDGTSPEDWLSIHKRKTALLFRSASLLGGIAVGAAHEQIAHLSKLGMAFGMAYQILDDIRDRSPLFMRVGPNAMEELLLDYESAAINAARQLFNGEELAAFVGHSLNSSSK